MQIISTFLYNLKQNNLFNVPMLVTVSYHLRIAKGIFLTIKIESQKNLNHWMIG